MSGQGDNVGAGQIRAFVERIESLDDQIGALNSDKSELYKEAKGEGFDSKIIRKVVAERRKDEAERAEQGALFDLCWDAVHGFAHAHVENIDESGAESDRLKSEPMPEADQSTAALKEVHPGSSASVSGSAQLASVPGAAAGTQAPPVDTNISRPRPEGCLNHEVCGSSTWRKRCHGCEVAFNAGRAVEIPHQGSIGK